MRSTGWPRRTGSVTAAPLSGPNQVGRQITYGVTIVDPLPCFWKVTFHRSRPLTVDGKLCIMTDSLSSVDAPPPTATSLARHSAKPLSAEEPLAENVTPVRRLAATPTFGPVGPVGPWPPWIPCCPW